MNGPEVWAYWGHEPSYHLKRMHSAPSIFALGEWADEWLDRLRSEECIQKAAEAGINMIYTSFYKGFGLDYERTEMEKTREVVRIAHKYNIKVLGYCQLETIYYETFLEEDPQAFDMAARLRDGSIGRWSNSYYRWRVCYNSERFWAYIKKVVAYGLNDLGLDGFHFDNSYMSICYCEKCKKDFRRYLEKNVKNPEEIMGINRFDHVEIPYFDESPGMIFDPLYLLWQRYRQDKCAQALDQIFAYVKEISEGKALVLHNPGFPRNAQTFNDKVFNPEFAGNHCDYVMAENKDNLVDDDGKITTQIMAYKLGKRFGYKVFESSWRTSKKRDGKEFDDYTSLNSNQYPGTYFDIAYYLSQSMIFGGIVGTPWLMRSTHNGGEMVIDDPLQMETHKKVNLYFKQNHSLYCEKNCNHLKILYYTDNLIGQSGKGMDTLKNVVNCVHNANIHFSFVTPDEIAELDKEQVILVPDAYFVSDTLYRDIESAVQRGCQVIFLGAFNVCNTYGKGKDIKVRRYKIPDALYVKMHDDWIGTIQSCLRQYIEVSSPNIVSEIMKDEEGNMLLHLLSTKDLGVRDIDIKLHGMGTVKNIEVHSFEEATAETKGDVIKLKSFHTMATLRIKGAI